MPETRVFNQPVTVTGPLTAPTAVAMDTASNVSGAVNALRFRTTTAQVNAGHTLLPALPGLKYRLHHAALIAVGGAAGGATSVRVSGTRGGAAHLFTALIAALTQNTYVPIGAASTSIQADGASFVALDANTPVTVNADGTLTTATHVDVLLLYSLSR